MTYSYADQTQIQTVNVSIIDEHDARADVSGVMIPVIIPADVVAELLANYDDTSSTSPVVAYSRPLARTLLDALKRFSEGGG